MNKDKARELLLEDIEKCRDTCINMFPNKELADYYQTWVDQVTNNCITDERLWKWIENQINYWGEKDRQYVKYIEQILNEGLENSTGETK